MKNRKSALDIYGKPDMTRIEFKRTKHWREPLHSERPMTAYEVYLDGKLIGTVEQAERHSYKLAGRLRYGDTYSVKWQSFLKNGDHAASHRIYSDTRTEALRWLIEEIERD